MQINLTSVPVDDQEKACQFYTETLGFQTKHEIALGEHRWLTVVSPEDPSGTDLLLEPDEHPAVRPFKSALVEDGIPFTSLAVSDVAAEFDRLTGSGCALHAAAHRPWNRDYGGVRRHVWKPDPDCRREGRGMRSAPGLLVTFCLGLTLVAFSFAAAGQQPDGVVGKQADDALPRIHYLEIVTRSINETCETLEKVHGLTFGEPVAELGTARIAELEGGGRIAVRGPLRDTEVPVVRPYLLVNDIHAAVQAAEETGALIAMPPTVIPGQGTFAIYLLGGIEHGLWEN